MAFHDFLWELQCRFAIPALGDVAFQRFAFVIYGTSKIVGLSVDLHEKGVLVPLPVRISE